jgi:uncharacterized protein YmfQ (DUF2313 family)
MTALNTTADYAQALSNLRPRGRVWPNDPASAQQQILAALAPTAERVDTAAQALLVDAFPSTSVQLLPEWEASLALNDAGDSTAQRQANVVAKLVAVGGQSAAAFEAFALTLGFTITIQTYAPTRCSFAECGDSLFGPDWSFAWEVTVVSNTGSMTSAELLAALEVIAPAETIVFLAS